MFRVPLCAAAVCTLVRLSLHIPVHAYRPSVTGNPTIISTTLFNKLTLPTQQLTGLQIKENFIKPSRYDIDGSKLRKCAKITCPKSKEARPGRGGQNPYSRWIKDAS